MNASVSIITPTGDRPLELCAMWMFGQGFNGPVQWIVVDDGAERAPPITVRPSWKLRYIRRPGSPKPPSVGSFVYNLLTGTTLVEHDLVVFVEDDDYYAPWYLQDTVDRLQNACAVGSVAQRYYHLPTQQFTRCVNQGAALCQTAFRRSLLPEFEEACRTALAKDSRGVDALFWRTILRKPTRYTWDLHEGLGVVGLKGGPGRPGLGLGHRPGESSLKWRRDPQYRVLREWVGTDVVHLLPEGVQRG